ncbi:MAG: PIG-L family deacetylase [Methanobrevibacter sp.]|jgi:LmbE family N-acetylglucosaminyl deacetylase|nr:PIG-L family deacetylase [Methanobrevibacter sp.]
MKKKKLFIFIVFIAIFAFLICSMIYNDKVASSNDKVAFIIPHPDDETIGAGGLIQMLQEKGYKLHFELITNGNLGDNVKSGGKTLNNFYNINLPLNATNKEKNGLIREDSFKQVMKVHGCDDYIMHHIDDETSNSDYVFNIMENLYLKEGYRIFYTVTGDYNHDHRSCHDAMAKMKEKYPDLIYRQFPIYYYIKSPYKNSFRDTHPTESLFKDYIDLDVDKYSNKKKQAFEVYYNIQILIPNFYSYSDGGISFSPERVYLTKNNDTDLK